MNNYFKQKNSNLTQRKNIILLIILLFLFNRYNLVKYFNMTFCFTKKQIISLKIKNTCYVVYFCKKRQKKPP